GRIGGNVTAIRGKAVSMIFPGMDPYLENPHLWTGVHSRLIVYIADQLQAQLRHRYVAGVEERVFIEGPRERGIVPDVHLRKPRPDLGDGVTAVLEADAPVMVRVPTLEIHESYVEILDLESNQRVV